jgi:hypothetical protein
LMKNLVLQTAYVGSQSYHLEVNVDTNTVQPQVCADPQGCASGGVGVAPVTATAPGRVPQGTTYLPPSARPNPYVNRVFERFFGGNSSYHALNISLVKRASNGLTFKTNYSYSKVLDWNSALDTASGVNQPSDTLNPANLKLNKGPAAFNLTQQFNTNFSYEMPFGHGKAWGGNSSNFVDKLIGGWQWNGIITVQPGFPFTPTVGTNRSGTGDTGNPDVPNVNAGRNKTNITSGASAGCTGLAAGTKVGTVAHWYDPCAFSLPIIGTFGNAGRDQLLGPGLFNLDTSLFKRISINERFNVQFRAEAFNIINHTNLGPPTLGVFSGANLSPSAGVITNTATTSRELQFALKLTF